MPAGWGNFSLLSANLRGPVEQETVVGCWAYGGTYDYLRGQGLKMLCKLACRWESILGFGKSAPGPRLVTLPRDLRDLFSSSKPQTSMCVLARCSCAFMLHGGGRVLQEKALKQLP
jgi:hypothetical protein